MPEKKTDEQKLKKAVLMAVPEDGEKYNFEFMFNPNEISINRKVTVSENPGARSDDLGIPKVSFAHPNATVITIKNIIFDVYENEKKDLGEKLGKLTQTVKFIKEGNKRRPPIYIFSWGDTNYLRCYVENVDYQLTLFLPDGTPARAKASITLKEIDPSFGEQNPSPSVQRERNSRWQQQQTEWV
jgi:hypothetical protein